MKFTAIDLFAGIGGFRLAVENHGGKCIAFSEIDADAINTYQKNFPGSEGTNLGDITKIKDMPSCDLLCGGVPCQSWSIAGKNLGFDDDRGQLWNDAIYLLSAAKPKAFIFENVKGLADPRNAAALGYICERIKEAGYFASCYVLNSFDYGVPQSRVRIYIVGFKDSAFHTAFCLVKNAGRKVRLKDIMDDEVVEYSVNNNGATDTVREKEAINSLFELSNALPVTTSLSTNNNGFNDYFLFNDLRNGTTTIHSWDIIETTDRQKDICLLLLRNRRKRAYGPLDGNPLSLHHFRSLDPTITQGDLDCLVELDILKSEHYAYSVKTSDADKANLSDHERIVLAKSTSLPLIPDLLSLDRFFKTHRINIAAVLESLESKGIIECIETRYDFRQTKISTGLFGVNRIVLPTSDIFPTLVASDSNDYLTPVSVVAKSEADYKRDFIEAVFKQGRYRKITRAEACRIQGFPEDFCLPESRSRWMKLIGNSVSVPVIECLIDAIINTGVFGYEHKTMDGMPSVSCGAECLQKLPVSPVSESTHGVTGTIDKQRDNQLCLFS